MHYESLHLLRLLGNRILLHLALCVYGSDFDLCPDRLESTVHFWCCYKAAPVGIHSMLGQALLLLLGNIR